MKAHTNDPSQPLIRLELTGQVKASVLFNPGHIELNGKTGQPISAKMTLTPADMTMDFKISQATARENKNIRFEIKRNDQGTSPYYELIVENIKKDPGIYADVITIWTNTGRKIPIRVFGNIVQ